MKIIIACFVGVLLSVGVGAETVVEGRVRLASGEPAAGAHIMLFDLANLRRGAVVRATTDASGQFVLSVGTGLPAGFALGQNYPNPFNPGTVIPYQLASASHVRLEVFNLLGQRVAVLVDAEQAAGVYRARWDGTDGAGRAAAAGVYLYRLTVAGSSQTGRMVLVDGQAGVPLGGSGVEVVPSLGTAGSYGLVVLGEGMVAYVDAAFEMASGSVVIEVATARGAAGKAAQGGVKILGDVDNNGRVESADALLVMAYSLKGTVSLPAGVDISLGDVDADGSITITDAWLIATYVVDPSDPVLPAGIGLPTEAFGTESSSFEGATVLALVEIGGKWGFIDREGTLVINPQFDDARGFSEGLALVNIGRNWGFIDREGTLVILSQFDDARGFSEGLALVNIDRNWGFIDREGTLVIDPQFYAAGRFSEGLAPVRIGSRWSGKWGFIDRQGTFVIDPQFDDAWGFSKGLAPVNIGGKWGFIDRQGTLVIFPQFDDAWSFLRIPN